MVLRCSEKVWVGRRPQKVACKRTGQWINHFNTVLAVGDISWANLWCGVGGDDPLIFSSTSVANFPNHKGRHVSTAVCLSLRQMSICSKHWSRRASVLSWWGLMILHWHAVYFQCVLALAHIFEIHNPWKSTTLKNGGSFQMIVNPYFKNGCFINTPRLGSSMLEGRPALQRKDWSTAPWLRNGGLASQVCRRVLTTMCGQIKKCLWFLRQHSSHLGGQGGFSFDSLYWQKCRLEGGRCCYYNAGRGFWCVPKLLGRASGPGLPCLGCSITGSFFTCEWWLGHPDAS